jgi:hypothetical protein
MKASILLMATALLASPVMAKKGEPTPLFANETPIHVIIKGPMGTLASNRAEVPRAATLTADGITYPITLTTRGITRKSADICEFPPLRVAFTGPAPPGSLFEHQKHLKLVTHCKRDAGFQQKLLLEYSAYKLYNLMTPQSFRARLANIDYLDDAGRPYISRLGYFLEEFSEVAKRNGMSEAHQPETISGALLDPAASGRFAVFEYMISNYDWSIRAGPKGTECCHNSRLLDPGNGSQLQPVPYDFDYSGLVDAPYSTPPEGIPISSVRQRTFRGYCAHVAAARAFAAQIAPRRAEFLGVFATIPGLEPREQTRAVNYIQGFFGDVDSGKIFKICVS